MFRNRWVSDRVVPQLGIRLEESLGCGSMPEYLWNINDTIYEEDAYRIYKACDTDIKRVMVSLAWVIGARPAEFLELRKENIIISQANVLFRVKTKKLRKGDFKVDYRNLNIVRNATSDDALYLETIIEYCNRLKPNDFLLPVGLRCMNRWIHRISMEAVNKPLALYHFRHSVLTHLAVSGKLGPRELMAWKGTNSMSSIMMYLNARPFMLNMKCINRSKHFDVSAYWDETKDESKGNAIVFLHPEETDGKVNPHDTQTEQPEQQIDTQITHTNPPVNDNETGLTGTNHISKNCLEGNEGQSDCPASTTNPDPDPVVKDSQNKRSKEVLEHE